MDYLNFFYQRLNKLRTLKGISARDMSLSLGQSESYINKIENRKALPSMSVFFYICDFLEIHPKDFFDDNQDNPFVSEMLSEKFSALSTEQQEHLVTLIDDLLKVNKKQ